MGCLGHSDAGVDENGNHRWSIVSVCFLLAAAVIGLYSRTLSHSLINLDDFLFVRDNTHIQQGLTLHGIQWAFTNWMAGHIGLLMIVGQFLAEWVQRLRISRTVVAVSTAAVTLTFMVLTWSEIGAWKSTETLFSRVLQTDPDHPWAHKTLGAEAAARGMHEEAMRRYARALAVRPDDASTLGLMAGSLAEMGEFEAAFERLRRALKHRPGHPNILFQYGTVLA